MEGPLGFLVLARSHQGHAGRHQRVQRHAGGDPHHHCQCGLGPEQGQCGPGPERAAEHHAQAALLHGSQGEDGQHLPADPQGRPPLYRVLPVSPRRRADSPGPSGESGVSSPDRRLLLRASERALRVCLTKVGNFPW